MGTQAVTCAPYASLIRRPALRWNLTLEERFWIKVNKDGPNGCWEWKASTANGYGRFWWGRGKSSLAHRYSYETTKGPVPEGLELDHLCRNRACVNPDHLEPVTRLVNQRRGNSPMQAQRKQTHCKRGGHPLDATNTYLWHGMRRCRICQADDARKYRARRNAA